MNRDDIIRMAREESAEAQKMYDAIREGTADFDDFLNGFLDDVRNFEYGKGCHDGAAAEREACAKVCDDKVAAEYATGKVDHNEMGWTQACAIAIRARGQK